MLTDQRHCHMVSQWGFLRLPIANARKNQLSAPTTPHQLRIEPLSQANWHQFEQLFGTKGACGNCWCMSFRLKNKDFDAGKMNDGNKTAMHNLVRAGKPAGILGFIGDLPMAWCAFAPREDFIKLANSRIHKPIDDESVWSIPCFFIAKNYRNQGLSVAMLKAIIQYAREQKIKVIEAYPTIPTKGKLPDTFARIGLYKSFERAGFQIVDQKSQYRPMVRCKTAR